MSKSTRIYVSRKYALAFWATTLVAMIGLCIVFAGDAGLSNISKTARIAGCFLLATLSAFGIYSAFSRRFEYGSVTDEAEPFITVNEAEIICDFPSQNKEERVRWDELAQVQVLTTDEGPAAPDVFLVLRDRQGRGVVIPQDKKECSRIVDIILKLPGFDYRTFTEAMGSTEVKWFNVWTKEPY